MHVQIIVQIIVQFALCRSSVAQRSGQLDRSRLLERIVQHSWSLVLLSRRVCEMYLYLRLAGLVVKTIHL